MKYLLSVLNTPVAMALPRDNRAFWNGLPESLREELLATQPVWVGSADGLPSEVRHRANTSLIAGEEKRLSERAEVLRARVAPRRRYQIGPSLDERELWYTDRKLKALAKVKGTLGRVSGAKLMVFDFASGDWAMAAFAVGDLDNANHISVTVPGVDTNVSASMGVMVNEARSLRDEGLKQLALAGRGSESFATVAWLGYEPPQHEGPEPGAKYLVWVRAANKRHALKGANRLARFCDGLRVASIHPLPHLTLLGHSYGSLTVGLSLQDPHPGQPVRDAVFYGSPGVNAYDESNLGLPSGHGWVLHAPDDWIANFGRTHRFGPSPGLSHFEQLSTKAGISPDGVFRTGVTSHADYPRDGQMSQYNLSVISVGLYDRAVRA